MSDNSHLEQYILRMPNMLADDVCDALVNEFAHSDDWELGSIGEAGKKNIYVRNCSLIEMSMKEVIEKNYETRKKLDTEVFNSVAKALTAYKSKFPKAGASVDSGYHLLRYLPGEYIKSHVDAGHNANRELSCSIGLNNEYTGGEFYFEEIDKTVRVEKGEIIMFPSNFMFPHEIRTITSGARYSIITWLS
jgi:predicted 2-oxoglutarate/Fe(II)-dependent dioxygenase YbiX